MRKIFTLLFLVFLTFSLSAQLGRTIDFEEGLADTAWTSFANGADTESLDFEIIANPYPEEINVSDSVFIFYVKEDADRWCGAYTDWDVQTTFTDENYMMALMVFKDIESPTKLKVESSINGGSDHTIEAVNSETGVWELLTYDFSEAIGSSYKRLTIFPDFPADDRDWGANQVMIDNIGSYTDQTAVHEVKGISLKFYPSPATNRMAVIADGLTAVTISDLSGKKIRTQNFSPRESKVIETGDLKSGVYICTAKTGKGIVSARFIKK